MSNGETSGTQERGSLGPEGVAGPSDRPQSLEWAQVDVFAEALHQGNQLAIFPDARGLSDEEMQRLARETNLSETTFVLPRDVADEQAHGIRVRIFTVVEELPFAGHPTLGTASWLKMHRPELRDATQVTLDLNVGAITVSFPVKQTGPAGSEPGVFGEMRQRDPVFGSIFARFEVAKALGLTVNDLHPALQPQVVSTGLPCLVVPLLSVEASRRLCTSTQEMQALLAGTGAQFAYTIAPIISELRITGAQWHARIQFYGGEDPATGSAAGCAISYLVRYGAVASGQDVVIEQGIEMLRPSRIMARATRDGEGVRDVRVAGRTIPVAAGRFFL